MAVPAIERDVLLQRIKETVLGFDPGAEVILFGSRARGDARPDSDWDILVLTSMPPTRMLDDAITEALYMLELDMGTVIVPIVRDAKTWHAIHVPDPYFHANVDREGIAL